MRGTRTQWQICPCISSYRMSDIGIGALYISTRFNSVAKSRKEGPFTELVMSAESGV